MSDPPRYERRRTRRVLFEGQATITTGDQKIVAATKDISERGLFVFTEAIVEVGNEIDILVTLPEELGLPVSGMVCCHGRVVRTERSAGECGLAVEIDRLGPAPVV
jgi:hypothetical protein